MSFERSLQSELDRVGIRGALARRIEAELADHRRCDPGRTARRSARARRAFRRRPARAAHTPCRAAWVRRALVDGAPARRRCVGLQRHGSMGAPRCSSGCAARSSPGAALRSCWNAQVAFVAGILAESCRSCLDESDQGSLLLVQRRLAVALVAGSVVIAAELTQTVAQGSAPARLGSSRSPQSPRWRRYRCFSLAVRTLRSRRAASRLPSRCEECSRHRCWWERRLPRSPPRLSAAL